MEHTCPFKLCVASSKEKLCNKSECELWSTEMSMCSIAMGMNAILSAFDALREISEILKSHYPED